MLSQRARYAIKALIALAKHPGGMTQVRTLADEANIPRRFLEVIMSDLRREGLIESVRGKAGGYRFGRPPSLISFADIIRVTDGPLALIPCVSRNFYSRCEDCKDEHTCELRRIMAVVRNRVSDVLDRTTLAEMVAGTAPDLADAVGE